MNSDARQAEARGPTKAFEVLPSERRRGKNNRKENLRGQKHLVFIMKPAVWPCYHLRNHNRQALHWNKVTKNVAIDLHMV